MLLLAFIVPIFSQAYNWGGNNFQWSATFKTTDSLKILAPLTYVILHDTVYTQAIDNSYDYMDGVYGCAFYATQYAAEDSTVDSIYIDLRLGYNFGPRGAPSVQWAPWYNILGPCTDYLLYNCTISVTDSTWWVPSNLIQYRLRGLDDDEGTDQDSLLIYFTDFRH